MFGKIFGVIILILIVIFCICSCKVAGWADQKMEDELRRKNQDEEENI